MRKLYNEFFHVPKHGKIREKVMLTRVITTVAVIVVCLAAMSLTAYAYFSYNVTSGSNIIKAANFETAVSITITDENNEAVANSQITPITSDHKNFRVEGLEAGKHYTVTITPTERSTATTGFVVVTADKCRDTYHTQQLGNDESVEGGRTEKIIFDLSVTADTTVYFVSHWGTSSHYDDFKDKGDSDKLYITNANIGNNAVKMVIDGVDNSVSDPKDEGKETTTTTQTTTTETTGTSTPTAATEPSSTTEPSASANTTESAATEPTDTTVSTKTQPTEATTGATTTEASE